MEGLELENQATRVPNMKVNTHTGSKQTPKQIGQHFALQHLSKHRPQILMISDIVEKEAKM